MKSSNLGKSNTIKQAKRLSMITFVAFCFATSLAHADVTKPKLWHEAVSGSTSELVLLDKEAKENEQAVKWLVTDAKEESYKKLVDTFQNEPLKMVQAFKLGLDEVKKSNKVEDFKKNTEKGLFSEEALKLWNGKSKVQSAYKTLFTDLLAMETIGDDYLEKLFSNKGLLADLNITDKKEGVTPKDKPSTGEKEDLASIVKPFCEGLKNKAQADIKAVTDKFEKLLADLDKKKQEEDKKRAEADRLAKEEAAKRQRAQDELNARLDAAELAKAQAVEAQAQVKKADPIDALGALVANAFKDNNKDNNVTPPTNSTPFIPQTASNRRDNDTEENPVIPDVQPQPQPGGINPLAFMNNPFGSNALTTPARIELPSFAADQQIGVLDAAATATKTAIRNSETAKTGIAAIDLANAATAKGELETTIANGESLKEAANKELRKMDQKLEELKDGARSALSSEDKAKLQSLQADLDSKKSQLQQAMQTSQMLSQFGDQTQGQQVASSVLFMQQQVAQAEQLYNRQKLAVDAAVEQANGQIRSLKVQRDNLQASISGLETQVNTASSKLKGVKDAMTEARAAAMQGNAQQGIPNINAIGRIQNGAVGGTVAGPRTASPLRGALGSQR